MQRSAVEETVANLNRLAQRPGVQATLVLSRTTGAIVQSSGLEPQAAEEGSAPTSGPEVGDHREGETDSEVPATRLASLEVTAKLVFDHVKASSSLARGLNGTKEDHLKLLRIRTKRNELVIVPDANYIAVIIHDTPPA